jgi:hypothetical protein
MTLSPFIVAIIAVASLTIATTAQAGEIRWHKNSDDSMYLEDEHGSRLILPEEYYQAETIALKHYAEVNPDSVDGHAISFDIRPDHIPSPNELAVWAHENSETWWQEDLLTVIYRDYERRAQAEATLNPGREQRELTRKKVSAATPDPSDALIHSLAAHNVQYDSKQGYADGHQVWYFKVQDPHSAKGFSVFVPVGSSEKIVMNAVRAMCLSASTVTVNGKLVLTPESKEELSWVRW